MAGEVVVISIEEAFPSIPPPARRICPLAGGLSKEEEAKLWSPGGL